MKFYPDGARLNDKIQYTIVWLLRLSLVLAACLAVFLGRWEALFISLTVLLLTFVPLLIERNYKIELPIEFEVTIIVFMYAAIFLGEVENFYERFWWWDLMLHGLSGALLAFTGFLILYLLKYHKKLSASPFIINLFAFCFALAMSALWEIFEFGMDELFGTNMQKSGLRDTMSDLIIAAIGGLVVAVLGYLYFKRRKHGIFGRSIASFLDSNPHLKNGVKHK